MASGGSLLTDAAGDVGPIQTSNKTYPGFDVVKLSIVSDGKRITVAATLKSPPADFASDVVELYFDIDNSKKTGAALLNPEIGGFEFKGQLDACTAFGDSSETRAGGSASAAAKPGRRYSIERLDRFKGASVSDGRQEVVDALGFAPAKAPHRAVPACRGHSTLGDKVYGNKTQAAEIGSVLTSRAGSRHSSEG